MKPGFPFPERAKLAPVKPATVYCMTCCFNFLTMSLLISMDGVLSHRRNSDHLGMDSSGLTTSLTKFGNSKSCVPRRKHKATLSHMEIYNGIPGTSHDKRASH